MKTIHYKGYQASVDYDDGTLFVKVLHISDLLVGECSLAADAPKVARDLVDDYLETCRELGRTPEPPFKGSFNVRMSPELHRKAAMAAADQDMSLNQWINTAAAEKLGLSGLSGRSGQDELQIPPYQS